MALNKRHHTHRGTGASSAASAASAASVVATGFSSRNSRAACEFCSKSIVLNNAGGFHFVDEFNFFDHKEAIHTFTCSRCINSESGYGSKLRFLRGIGDNAGVTVVGYACRNAGSSAGSTSSSSFVIRLSPKRKAAAPPTVFQQMIAGDVSSLTAVTSDDIPALEPAHFSLQTNRTDIDHGHSMSVSPADVTPDTSFGSFKVKVEQQDGVAASQAISRTKRLVHPTFSNARQVAKKRKVNSGEPTAPDDDDVEVIKLVQTTIRTENDVVFNQDGAKTEIRPSELVPGQLGLYSSERILDKTIVTWYTGQVFRKARTVARTMREHAMGDENDVVANNPAAYFFDVAVDNRIVYYINGFVPDRLFGGDRRCNGTYVNHHQTRANVVSEIVHVKGQNGVGVHRVALRAICDIEKDTELLLDYGERFHKQMQEQGILKQ